MDTATKSNAKSKAVGICSGFENSFLRLERFVERAPASAKTAASAASANRGTTRARASARLKIADITRIRTYIIAVAATIAAPSSAVMPSEAARRATTTVAAVEE